MREVGGGGGKERGREGGKGKEGMKASIRYNLNYLTTRMIISSCNLMYNLLRIFEVELMLPLSVRFPNRKIFLAC